MRLPAFILLPLWGLCMVNGFAVIIAAQPGTRMGATVAVIVAAMLAAAITLLVRWAFTAGYDRANEDDAFIRRACGARRKFRPGAN